MMEWGINDEPAYPMVFKQGLPWHVEEIEKSDQKKLFAVET